MSYAAARNWAVTKEWARGFDDARAALAQAPAAAPLTDEQIKAIYGELCNTVGCSYQSMARAVERAHGIGAAQELDAWQCDHCGGEGWTWQPRQVAERDTDVQTVKIHCDECGGTGWCGPDAEKAAKEQP